MAKNSLLANLPCYSNKNFTGVSRSPNTVKPPSGNSKAKNNTTKVIQSLLSSKQLDNEKGKGIIVHHFIKLQERVTKGNGGLSSADDNLHSKKRKSIVNGRNNSSMNSLKKNKKTY